MRTALLCSALCGILAIGSTATAQTFTTLKSFGDLTNITGLHPRSQLEQGPDGTLYGTAADGGSSYRGTVFKLNSDGSGFTVLKVFTNSTEGANPYGGVTLSGSVLYGTTGQGGSSDEGTVFKVNTDGTGYTVLKHFNSTNGAYPRGLLLSGSVLYGTTSGGGSSSNGTVFKMNTDGTGFTVLKHFTGGDGAYPLATLTLSGNVLYGTTSEGGFWTYGTVFKVNTDGSGYAVRKHFSSGFDDGAWPVAGVILSGSVLYGTTQSGGDPGYGTVFKVSTDGTGYAVLKHFNQSDGQEPSAGLLLSGSMLYGTTRVGGNSSDWGTVFKVSTNGTGFAVLKHFNNSEGQEPSAGLLLSGSVLYGTTLLGGSLGEGTLFKLDLTGALTPIPLTVQAVGGAIILHWSNPAFALQAAPLVTGTYTNIPGATSPYTNAISEPQRFFRLIGN